MRKIALVSIAALGLAASGAQEAAAQQVKVTGKVESRDGSPVAGLPLKVTGPMGDMILFTDNSGRWRLTDQLAPGGYTVESLKGNGDRLTRFDVKDPSFFDRLRSGSIDAGTVVVSPEVEAMGCAKGC